MSEMALASNGVLLPEKSAPALEAHLAGVAFTSPDTKRLSDFYVKAMGFEPLSDGETWLGALDNRWVSARQGEGNAIDHVAFAVSGEDGLAALKDRLASAFVAFQEVAGATDFDGAIRLNDPDGNGLVFGVAKPGAERRAETAPCRLQHVVFASDEAPAMVSFYCDVLGFAPSDYVRDPEGDLTSAFLRCSTEHHSLAVFRAPRKRLDHLCYDVENWAHIRDWADRFAALHVALKWGPGRHGPGNNLFFFINDPDGNWLEFSAELEHVEDARDIKHWAHEERTLNSWGAAIMRS